MGIGDRYQEETKYTRQSLAVKGPETIETAEPFKEFPHAKKVAALSRPLPKPRADLWDVFLRRRSRRDFVAGELSARELELLVFAVQGVTAQHGGYLFRTAPSAGALYPVETYLQVNRIENVERGVYHLNVVKGCLELIRAGDFARELTSAALGQSMVASGCVTFIWTAIPGRSKWKYRERAYRYIYLDAGHIGQNLYLAAEALGLGCCTIGAFFDHEVNAIVGLDGEHETAIYMGAVGRVG